MTRGSPACLPPRSDPPDRGDSNGTIAVTAPRGQLSLVSSNARIGIAATDAAVRASSANGEIAFAGSLATGPQSFGTSNPAIALHLGPMRRSAWTSRPRTRRWPSATRSRPARRPRRPGSPGGLASRLRSPSRRGPATAGSRSFRRRRGWRATGWHPPSSTDCGCRAPPTADVALALLATTGALTLAGWAVFRFLERRARERGLLDQAAGS